MQHPTRRLIASAWLGWTVTSLLAFTAVPAVAQDATAASVSDAELAALRARIDALEAEQKKLKTAQADANLKVSWSNGAPTFSSADGAFSYHPRLRLMLDDDFSFNSAYDERNQDTTGTRSVRLGLAGKVGKPLAYLIDVETADNKTDVQNAWLAWRSKVAGLDWELRAGNSFNDRSLEGTTFASETPFMERNVVAAAILPQHGFFGNGLAGRIGARNWHASLALRGDDIDGAYAERDAWTLSSRVHVNPLLNDNGMLHLGLWGFSESLGAAQRDFSRSTIIGARFSPDIRIQSGPIEGAEDSLGYGAELAASWKSVVAWAEAGQLSVGTADDAATADFVTDAWAVAASWQVTGDPIPYSGRSGSFVIPTVKRSVLDGGPGLLTLSTRYEYLSYRDLPSGGAGGALTLGVSWYLTSAVRLMADWAHWETDNRSGNFQGEDDGDSITLRTQLSF